MTKQPHDSLKYCSAKTRGGTPCKRPSGWGTNHVGEGRCKLHGGKSDGAPKSNQNAKKHGFFSKYIPQETLEIMGMLEDKSPADLIWDQIQIQYAAIIRAQQIMFVTDKKEMIKELKKAKFEVVPDDEGGFKQIPIEEEYEFQFAWDRQATFLNAQSRAMSELRSLIKQFNELAHEEDERRLMLEQMQLAVDKSKVELGILRGDTEGDAHKQINSFVEALNAQADNVFADEVETDEET